MNVHRLRDPKALLDAVIAGIYLLCLGLWWLWLAFLACAAVLGFALVFLAAL